MEVLTCESYDDVLGPRFVPSWMSRFRTRDPIHNLAIKITLTKVKEPTNDPASPTSSPARRQREPEDREGPKEGEDPDEEATPPPSPKLDPGPAQTPITPMPSSPIPKSQIRPTTQMFNWQQKVFGKSQLEALRSESYEPNSQIERQLLSKVRSEDNSRRSRGLDGLVGQPLFSQIDSEGPINPFSDSGDPTDGGLQRPGLEKLRDLAKKQDREELQHWAAFEGMAVYAEIEHPPHLLDAEQGVTLAARSYAQPLLYIKHNADGLVEMHPSFNTEEQVVHQFTTPYGVVYHYQIENANGLSSLQEREVAAVDELSKVLKQTRLKNEVGDKFSVPPAWPTKRLHVFGEIASAQGFEADKDFHFVEAQLVLPERVVLEPACSAAVANSEVATQMSKPAVNAMGEGVWHFGLPFELEMRELEAGGALPRLYLCVNSLDSWERHRVEGYSHVDIPLTAGSYSLTGSAWKPKGTIRESMQDFFVGGALQLVHHQHPVPPASVKTRCLSYHGFQTVSTGSVTVKVHVVVQHAGAHSREVAQRRSTAEGFELSKESQAEAQEREMEEMELRARLVKRAQDRVNKYNMLDASSVKKSPGKARRASRSDLRRTNSNSELRGAEPTEVRRASNDSSEPSRGANKLRAGGSKLRASQRLPRRPRQPKVQATPDGDETATPVPERVEQNVLAEPVESTVQDAGEGGAPPEMKSDDASADQ